MEGLEKLAAREGLALRDFLGRVDAIVHGTTVGDNTLIEGNGAVTGLLTTAGFRDELELRRGFKEDIWDVRLPPPQPDRAAPPPPDGARAGALRRQRSHTPLDEAAARRRAAAARRARASSRSRSALLFSFVNPAHERRLAELAAEELPGVPLSISHEVMPKAPEFERTSTTVVNAYIGPRVSGYLDRLSERLRAAGFPRELLVMQSSGGVDDARVPARGAGAHPGLGAGRRRDRRRARRRRQGRAGPARASTWAARATTSRSCAAASRPRSPAGTGTTAT